MLMSAECVNVQLFAEVIAKAALEGNTTSTPACSAAPNKYSYLSPTGSIRNTAHFCDLLH